jgi:hypothetical protein
MQWVPLTGRLALLLLAAAPACTKPPPEPAPPPARHEHHPPHGGTAVVLGPELYHLEFVLDPAAGRLQAYVLDGELETFIRVPQRSLELTVTLPGPSRPLVMTAVASPATGETAGDTALFEAQADWLRGATAFDATLRQVTIRGTSFTDVAFHFPHGNDRD